MLKSVNRVFTPSWNRTLFTLPTLPFFPNSGGSENQTFHERKILPYKRQQIYDVVSDVNAYKSFLPFCVGSRVLSRKESSHRLEPTVMEAELTVRFLTFKESYVSTVTCIPYESVRAVASSLNSSLFKSLETTWQFQPASPQSPHASSVDPLQDHTFKDSCRTIVSCNVSFAFANPIHAAVSAAFFEKLSKVMIKTFEDRCLQVYGKGSQ